VNGYLERTIDLQVLNLIVVHFLAIHPFEDGNGRLSRIVTTLLLLKSGYRYVPYSSIERIVKWNGSGKATWYSPGR